MSTRVVWSRWARQDLRELELWILEESGAERAEVIIESILDSVARLARFPESGRLVPELLRIGERGYREVVVTPWRVVYRVAARPVVLAVFDGRRDLFTELGFLARRR